MSSYERPDGRRPDELRPVLIEPGFVSTATGSALISCGGTRVICTASIEEGVPRWRAGKGLAGVHEMQPTSGHADELSLRGMPCLRSRANQPGRAPASRPGQPDETQRP